MTRVIVNIRHTILLPLPAFKHHRRFLPPLPLQEREQTNTQTQEDT